MSKRIHTTTLIIGAGPAGYSAAIYAARAALEPIVVTGSQPGGQLTITTDVENYPGFADVIQGPWLMEQMALQAQHVGAKIINDHIIKVDFNVRPFVAYGDSSDVYTSDAVIIATGAQATWLGLESEKKFQGFGVSGCATCDGFFFRNRTVMVIGGGNTAVEEALYLTKHAAKVILVHRRDSLRAEKILQQRLLEHPKVSIRWNSVLQEVLGNDNPLTVTGARLLNVQTQQEEVLDVDGVFIAIGHKPNTEIFKEYLQMDAHGYINTSADSTATNIAGVFAAGDVQDKIYRQAVTAAGTGCMAALEAGKYLSEIKN